MIREETTKYKSWSNLRKQMNDLLCDSLRDKITYFFTTYYGGRRTYGKATINYNKKEVVAFSWDAEYSQWDDEYKILLLEDLQGLENQISVEEKLMKDKWMPECKLCDADFINAITVYLNTDIATSLSSDNYLLRVFAYMDRRVGKRTLVKIKDEVETLPEWVKQFYNLRCKAEGITS